MLAGCARQPSPGVEPRERTHDGRFGSECYRKMGGVENPAQYCHIPMARLIADPERFHDNRIIVVGFLIESDGIIALFPSQDSWYQGVTNESIALDLTEEHRELRQLRHRLKEGYGGVEVVGRFDAKASEADGMRLGTMRNVVGVHVNVTHHGPEPPIN